MAGPRYGHSSIIIGNSLLVVGGYAVPDVDSCEPESLSSAESYNLFFERWEKLPDAPITTSFGSLVKVNEHIVYLMGGISGLEMLSTVQ